MTIKIPKYFTKQDIRICGIYFLTRKNRVVYIGKSVDLFTRAFSSDHPPDLKFDKVRIIKCDYEDMARYEKRWIIRFRPQYNFIHLFKINGSFRSKRERVAINQPEVKKDGLTSYVEDACRRQSKFKEQ